MVSAARPFITSQPIQAAKQALRSHVRTMLAAMPAEERKFQSKIITAKLFDNERYRSSHRVSVFLSMSHEVDTFDILRNCFDSGKDVFVPKYDANSRGMQMIKLRSLDEYDRLPLTAWKIKQPTDDECFSNEEALATGGLDLMIVPGLGFTKSGQRIGAGRGYYDVYLDNCMHDPHGHPYTIGLAFAEQMFRSIPMDKHDVPLDKVITMDELRG